jgi:hypothetical protein
MPLAGRLKLRTFLWLVGGGVVAGVGVLGLGTFLFGAALLAAIVPAAPPDLPVPPDPPPWNLPSGPPTLELAPSPVVPTTASPAPSGLADHEVEVLKYQGKNLGSDKIKDSRSSAPWKVNVYQDAGQATANRAKVDLDRDEKWDLKYTFEPDGRVRRQTAPADDEVYRQVELWDGTAWSPE